MYPFRFSFFALLITFLAGCGGGGGGGAPAPAAAVNQAPVVTVTPLALPASTRDTVVLAGSATDDGGPPAAQWTQVDGPAAAVIASPTSPSTTATFPALGTYHLRLSATDGTLNGYADLTVSVIDPYVTVAGVEFDTRHSADPTFAATDAPQVDLYLTETHWNPATRNHYRFTYAAGTDRTVPCVVMVATTVSAWVSDPTQIDTFIGTMYLATATDGSVYCLKDQTNPGSAWSEPTSDPIVVLKALPASPSFPLTWTSLCHLGPTGAKTFAYTAPATSPNGITGCYQVALPLDGFDLDGSYSWYFVYNPDGATRTLRWMYFKPGVGIVDYDGASLVAPANG